MHAEKKKNCDESHFSMEYGRKKHNGRKKLNIKGDCGKKFDGMRKLS